MEVKRFEKVLEQLMRFGELKLDILKKEHGWKIVVIEYSLDTWYDVDSGKQLEPEESNAVILTIHTDNGGTVNFIEHPYQAFTKGNAATVTFVASLVDITIDGLSEDLSTYGRSEK